MWCDRPQQQQQEQQSDNELEDDKSNHESTTDIPRSGLAYAEFQGPPPTYDDRQDYQAEVSTFKDNDLVSYAQIQRPAGYSKKSPVMAPPGDQYANLPQ